MVLERSEKVRYSSNFFRLLDMAQLSAIEWTEATWNPVTGCTKISPGCKHCYAERMALRLQAMGQPNYAQRLRAERCTSTCSTRRCDGRSPAAIFVNSMSDLFHDGVPVDFIREVFDVMRRAHWHQFQVLDQALGATARAWTSCRLAAERVDGRERRESEVRVPDRAPAHRRRLASSSCRSNRCSARFRETRSVGHRLGDRRRRVRPGARPMDAAWVDRHPRSVHRRPACRSSSSSGAG